MNNRKFNSDKYIYGFNGMEKDPEIKPSGNSYDFGARLFDPRLGRWLTIDPMQMKYPAVTPYIYAVNSPILFFDPDGKDFYITTPGQKPSKADKQFFKLMNERAGNIFEYDKKTGKVTLKEGAKVSDVVSSKTVSQTLAQNIDNGINAKQVVYFQAVNDEATSDKVFYDQASTGQVDVADLNASDAVTQAAIMTHFIAERYSFTDYEKDKTGVMAAANKQKDGGVLTAEEQTQANIWTNAHNTGIAQENLVIQEMLGVSTDNKRDEKDGKISDTPRGDGTYTKTSTFEYGMGVTITFTTLHNNLKHVISAKISVDDTKQPAKEQEGDGDH